MMGIEFVHISADTTIDALEKELFWNDIAWKMNGYGEGMLEHYKAGVFRANLQLPKYGLVSFTWGKSPGGQGSGLFVIKPSGVSTRRWRPEDMVVMDLEGKKIEGDLNPSTDTPTHMELYRNFPEAGGSSTRIQMGHELGASRARYPCLWDDPQRTISMEVCLAVVA